MKLLNTKRATGVRRERMYYIRIINKHIKLIINVVGSPWVCLLEVARMD